MSNKSASKQIFEIQMTILSLRHDKDVPPHIIFALGEIHARLEAAKDTAKAQEDASAALLKLRMSEHTDDMSNILQGLSNLITPKSNIKEGK